VLLSIVVHQLGPVHWIVSHILHATFLVARDLWGLYTNLFARALSRPEGAVGINMGVYWYVCKGMMVP
jgi:hypothetical protein